MNILVLVASLAATADIADWLALRVTTVDSSTVFAHDARSGVMVRYGSQRDAASILDGLRRSPRLLSRQSGERGSHTWQVVELADPSSDVKGLVKDLGQVPPAGSWLSAVLEAFSPPIGCDRELQYFLRSGSERYVVFTAVPCNAEQRSRTASLVEAFMSGSSPSEVARREAFGPTGAVSQEDLSWLNTGPTVEQVLARLGTPTDVWPRYPDGFTLEYKDADAKPDGYIAVDFGRTRSVARVRVLLPVTWAP